MIKFLELKRAYYADPENVVVEYNSRRLNRWQKCVGEPLWCEKEEYRIRPRTIRIGDIDVPEPVRVGLKERIRQLEAQPVPVAGEPTDAAYKWMIANGVEPMTSLHKLGERLAALLDEDQFSECEALLLTAITAINTFVPVPAAELASLREKAAEADELRKDAERLQFMIDETAILMYSVGIDRTLCRVEWPLTGYVQDAFYPSERAAIDAAIAQGKGE